MSPEHVDVLAASIREHGLQQPVVIRRDAAGKLSLICGAHRLAAAKQIALTTVTARVLEGITDQEARLIEVDENLIRHELTVFDRAASLAMRKTIYEELHPEAKRGAAGGKARQKSATAIFAVGFAKATAEKTRLSERTIRRAIAMYNGLDPEARDRIAGSDLADKEGELFKLSKEPKAKQRNAVALILDKEPKATTVAGALNVLNGKTVRPPSPTDAQLQKLIDAWERAGKPARKRFLAHLQKSGVNLLGGPAQ